MVELRNEYLQDQAPFRDKFRFLKSFVEREVLLKPENNGVYVIDGNIYATAGRDEKSGIYVFSPAGKHLALIKLPGAPTNCVFGGGDHARTLFITAPGPMVAKEDETQRYALYKITLAKVGYHLENSTTK